MTEEQTEVKQLQEDIYELCGKLHENSALMTEDLSEMMNDDLRDLYKEEYRRIRYRYEIEHAREEFGALERIALYVPRARRFLWFHKENVAAKLIIEEADIEADRFFAEQEAENDENRPDYMPKMYLTRAQKREARREARRERRAEREKRKRLRKLERDRKNKTKKERKREARDAALAARKARRTKHRPMKSPKTGTRRT